MTEADQLTVANLIIAITTYRQLQEPRRVMGLENLEPERVRHAAAMAEAEARLDSALTRAMKLTDTPAAPMTWEEAEQRRIEGNKRFDAHYDAHEAERARRELKPPASHE